MIGKAWWFTSAVSTVILVGACANDGAISRDSQTDQSSGPNATSSGPHSTGDNHSSGGQADASDDPSTDAAVGTHAPSNQTETVDDQGDAANEPADASHTDGPDSDVEQTETADPSSTTSAAESGIDTPLAIEDDPQFVSVDGPFAVLKVVDNGSGNSRQYRVDVLELGTGAVRTVSEVAEHFGQSDAHPRRDMIFFDHRFSAPAARSSVMYLSDKGFVPPRLPPNYTDQISGDWTLMTWHWSNDGQLGAVGRYLAEGDAYVDFIDGRSGALLGSQPVPTVSELWTFGGHVFHYASDYGDHYTLGAATPQVDGLWNFVFPLGGDTMVGHDGTAYYTYPDETDTLVLAKVAPGAEPTTLELPAEFSIGELATAPRNGNWLLLTTAQEDGSRLFALPLNGGDPVFVDELQGFVGRFPQESANGEWLFMELESEQRAWFAVRAADMHTVLLEPNNGFSVATEVVGNHFALQSETGPLRYIGFDGQESVEMEVPGTGGDLSAGCVDSPLSKPPLERNVVGLGSQTLILVDLSEPQARIVGQIDATDGSFDCPTWSIDGTSFVYTEQSAEEWRLFRVVWGTGGPEAPQLIYTSTQSISPVALR